jgi:predicted outer membrane protein
MRTEHRESRAGQHRPEYGERGPSRRRRSSGASKRGWVKLLPLVAFLAVGALTVWMAVGFNSDGKDAGIAVAGATEKTATGTGPAPVSDNGSTAGGSTPGSNSGGGADNTGGAVEQTKYGPLTAADKDFLDKVWQAGSWEGPTGRQAQERASSQKVKDVGLTLAADHAQLDAKVTAVAQQLGHTLPTKPSALQQGWMDQLSQVQGEEYDRLFADLLRAAHGKVFAVIADIRAGTKNGMVRAFAQTANAAVLKHMTILEGTGLVTFSKLPNSKQPTAAPPATGSGKDNAQPSSGQDSNNSGSNSNNGSNSNGNNTGQFDPNLSPNQQDQALTPTSSNRPNKGGGVDNYIIVIMLSVAGIVSAVTYRQLHRRRS